MSAEVTYRVLIVDLVGLSLGADGQPSPAELEAYVAERGAHFHRGSASAAGALAQGVNFFYTPELSTEEEILREASVGYDAVIAAATIIPAAASFPLGGVRIGAGTGNMRSESWGGGSGAGGVAPLMNTPGINSRATAQMVFKAIMRLRPDLPLERLHALASTGQFDTGRDLRDYPTRKLETYRLAVIGFGNIGRDVARLGRAFGMDVTVYARPRHRERIEAEGFNYAASMVDAARGADILSVHIGLGPLDASSGRYANSGAVNDAVLAALNPDALVVNFDRGEVIDADHLARAMASGQVGHAAVDADIFVAAGEAPKGPLAPYLALVSAFNDRLLLLPHAAADTDHPSRVAGARQAVDQILDVLLRQRVVNLVGQCPPGFVDAGPSGDPVILGATASHLASLAGSKDLETLSSELAGLQSFVATLADGRATPEQSQSGLLSASRVRTLLDRLALSAAP